MDTALACMRGMADCIPVKGNGCYIRQGGYIRKEKSRILPICGRLTKWERTYNNMEEIRIDVTKQTPEELALANEHAQLIFRFNHTMRGQPNMMS